MILALRITNSKYSLMLSSGYFILFPKIISHILNLVSQGLDKKKKITTSWFIFCARLLYAQSMCIVEPDYVSEYIKPTICKYH